MIDPRFSSALMDVLHDRAPMILVTMDADGKVLAANRFARMIFGQSPEGLNFKDLIVDFTDATDILKAAEHPEREQLINIGTSEGLPQSYHFSFLKRDETILAMGRPDVAELEQLRTSLIDMNQELNNLTRELHKKNAELEALNEQKNRFLGMAAHDLRTPLGTIQIYSEFILDEVAHLFGPEHQEFMKIIRSASDFMLNLVDDLLDLARIESGKLVLNRVPCAIADLVERNVWINRALAVRKEIELDFIKHGELPQVSVDPAKMEQVLNNLITNAIKFSNPNTRIEVHLRHLDDTVVIQVKDQGQGIPAKEIEKLFEPFQQVSVRSTAGEKRTGLGLAIVRKIVAGHGGRVWVESAEGEGSSFFVSLPAPEVGGDSPPATAEGGNRS